MTTQVLRVLFISTLLLGFVLDMKAQVSIGFRGGLLLNTFDKKPLANNEPKPSQKTAYQLAIPIEISFGDVFAIQPEVMFGSHGGIQQESRTVVDGIFTSKLEYKADFTINALEIPLLAKAKFGSETLKFYALAGPSFGFGLNGKSDVHTYAQISSILGTYEQTSDEVFTAKFVEDGYDPPSVREKEFPVAKTNLNLHLGAGLILDFGNVSIFADGRYLMGLSDLTPDARDTPEADKITTRSRRVGLSVGLMFSLK